MTEELLQEILEKYEIRFTGARRIRGAVLCSAGERQYLLKETTAPAKRTELLEKLYAHLEEQKDLAVDAPVKNREAALVTVGADGRSYMLRRWYAGRECDVRRPAEVLAITGNLAKLHMAMRVKLDGLSEATPLSVRYEQHDRELRKVRRFVRAQSKKGAFELLFLREFDRMSDGAARAEALLSSSGYRELYQESMQKNCLIHGEYNYHHVLMAESGKGNRAQVEATTGFEKCRRQIQAEDLFYLLRKVMEKYSFSERLGDNMLNAYSAIRPLTRAEIEYLKIRLLYPEKFWKTVNLYYHSNKAWMPAKHLEKLETAVRQSREKERFIQSVFGM